jgi:hypothetical protein
MFTYALPLKNAMQTISGLHSIFFSGLFQIQIVRLIKGVRLSLQNFFKTGVRFYLDFSCNQ